MTQRTPVIQSQPTQSEVVSNVPPNKSDLKTILFVILGLMIVAGITYGACTFGKKQSINRNNITVFPTKTINQLTRSALPTEAVVPISDTTANWKTYRNEKYGFEFKYPVSWELFDKENVVRVKDTRDETASEKRGIFSVLVYIEDKILNTPIDVWVKDNFESPKIS